MNKALIKGFKQARKAIEELYDSKCNVTCYGPVKDPITKITGEGTINKYDDKPCRVAKQTLGKNKQTDTTNEITYEVKLIIAPELVINQGDEIEVTNALGTKKKYTAGEGFGYHTHQEVILNKEGKA